MIYDEKSMQAAFESASFKNLSKSKSLIIKKDYLNLGCCSDQNQYEIYSKESLSGAESQPIFQCSEISTCCQRNFCCGSCRGFKLAISDFSSSADYSPLQNETIIEFVKPYQFTFCCFNRPEMEIYIIESQKRTYLGKIKIPCTSYCNTISLEVQDSSNAKKFTVQQSYCSNLIACGSCCFSKKCQQGSIKIIDETYTESVLDIQYPKCCVSKTNYELQFPQTYQTKDKLLLLAAIFMFDMCIIEDDNRKRGKSCC